ncbi:alginate lyase [Aurantiacibacter xanthus]|uniref:Alginate lyase n=1 Tax=Aurantiacibacter xanthus TaxID=1784712 RepID=A0A3A1PFB9_9SPHN|nr:alginate lyase family protein [Aurantiacibacter xanthus]RIV91460.1 alginate lyase [Aurantiacibacter xanthus]
MIRRALIVSLALAGCAPVHARQAPASLPPALPAADLPPLFAAEVEDARSFVDAMMERGVVVPVPRDPGGGYTHEQHKRNYKAIYLGGQLYRVTGQQAYADYVRDLLLAYAELYPTLGDHPARANQNPGRLFWQVLNDAVWLVHSVQGYGDIRDTLSEADRQLIDDQVFRRAAQFLSVDSQATFDRIHNHATWAAAGVGMTGYLLGDDDLVERALMGSDKSGTTGFLRQTELLFSPDGYYTEGPYYQRYALMPFMVFADVIAKHDPDRHIFQWRDGILLKALQTTIQLTYDGYFFPFNDALRDKSLNTDELYHGVAIAYAETEDSGLLDIARSQGRTILTDDGLKLARDLAAGKARPFPFRSLLLSDGPEGDQGAVAILRHGEGDGHMALVAKNTSQGMGHGHFDKLSWQLYDNGHEIVRDYGAARFLNIVAKEGGRYLPENESWAKQTIAHNALVINGESHFGGDQKLADLHAPQQLYYDAGADLQISTATIDSAYPEHGVTMTRSLALLDVAGLDAPVVIDLLNASGNGSLTYDLPLHYTGQIMETGFPVSRNLAERPVLGEANGYQHIWVDGTATPTADNAFMTWILGGRFYTYRFVPQDSLSVILGESGANDPHFNLRREPMIIQRKSGGTAASFVSVLESHGLYDGAAEETVGSRSQIASLRHETRDGYDFVIVETTSGTRTALALSYDRDPTKTHNAKIDGTDVRWTGFAARIALDGEND